MEIGMNQQARSVIQRLGFFLARKTKVVMRKRMCESAKATQWEQYPPKPERES